MIKGLQFLVEIVVTTMLAAIIALSILNYNRIRATTPHIFQFCLMALVIQIVSSTMNHYSINNLWLLHIYTLAEFVLIALFYYRALELKPNTGRYKIGVSVFALISCFMVVNSLFFQTLDEYNSWSKTVECITFCALAIIYYLQELRQLEQQTKQDYSKDGKLIINTAILLLFSGQFFIYLMSEYLTVEISKIYLRSLWLFNGVLNVLFYIILFIGIWKLALPKRNYSG